MTGSLTVADTNLVITGLDNGMLSWMNVNTNLYYSVQWKPSLTGTNEWGESYRMLQDVQSAGDIIEAPIPMFFQIVGRSNQTHTMQVDPGSSTLAEGYYEATDLTSIDPDLDAGNIVSGTTVFGVTGTYGKVPVDSNAIYVAASYGVDTGSSGLIPGDPCQTITWGIQRASATGRDTIYYHVTVNISYNRFV